MFTTYLKTNFSTPSNPSATAATYTSLTYDEECSLEDTLFDNLLKKSKNEAPLVHVLPRASQAIIDMATCSHVAISQRCGQIK